MVDPITIVLAGITIGGTIAGIAKWYKNTSIKNLTERFKDDKVHNKLEMNVKELEKDYKFLLERQIDLEQEVKDALREISELRGKIE